MNAVRHLSFLEPHLTPGRPAVDVAVAALPVVPSRLHAHVPLQC